MKHFSCKLNLTFPLRILFDMKMEYICFAFLLLLSSSVFADDAVKNHRAEKRQDNSFVFFGGWRPVKTSNDFYHGSASGRFHDLISALPGSYDPSANLYTHSFPSSYPKDIFSYYPRPAIKATPKKNTPVYVERFKPRRQQPKQGGRNTVSSGAPQFIDIQNLDLKHLRGLQDVLLQAKELPLTQLNLQNNGGKKFEIVEVSVQALQQNNHNTGSRTVSRYNRNRSAQRNNKGSYGIIPQNLAPAQLPLQFQYITVPKVKSRVPQVLPKQISVTPVKIPHPVPSVDDILGIKNIQVVEVPVPGSLPISISTSKLSGGSQYGKRNNAYNQPQYRRPSPKSPPKVSFPANTYYAHQAEQPRKHYPAPSPAKSSYSQQQQPQIEAELIKLSEDQVQDLLKNLQVVKKNSQDFLKMLPIAEAAHKSKPEQVHLIVALPQSNQGHNVETAAYESQSHGEKDTSYGSKEQQYIAVPQQLSYPSHDAASISHNSGGYQISSHNQGVEHNAAGYQIDEHTGNIYEQQSYQTIDGPSNYGQKSYEAGQKTEHATAEGHRYAQAGYGAPTQQGIQAHREQYIEVISPNSDENGYRREPVLAIEIQKGQTIEDAIKAIDPDTLQRLGAHGKDGLEIEVVEVPVDEYSSESKKTETYVSSSNSTTKAPAKKTTTPSTTVSIEKSTTTANKS